MDPDLQSNVSTERKHFFKDEYAMKSEQFISSKEADRKIIYLSTHPTKVWKKIKKKTTMEDFSCHQEWVIFHITGLR